MKKTIASMALSLALMSSTGMAEERATDAVSAVVRRPIGALAGAVHRLFAHSGSPNQSSTQRDVAIRRSVQEASSTSRSFAEIGGLLSFGADGPAAFRHGTTFVHRILQGKAPKDLPIEQPTKFDLAVNLKTAKAIGVVIPETFLLRADAVIE
jgi:ABC transporter substrate binding protein